MGKLKITKMRILVFVLCSILIFSTLFFYKPCEKWLNNIFYREPAIILNDCELTLHFIDVGQGDSILINFPDDKVMLVDTGPNASSEKLLQYLGSFYKSRQDKVLDYLVVTHDDEDHYGGASAVLDTYDVKNCFRPSVFTSDEAEEKGFVDVSINDYIGYKDFIQSLKSEIENGCKEYYNNTDLTNLVDFASLEYSLTFLAPLDDKCDESNDYSAVIQIEYKNRKILLTADAEDNIEERLINLYQDNLQSDILKVGHHGSKTSTTSDFLKIVKPSYAVISVGKDNDYKHPSDEVVARLNATVGNDNIYRTDTQGNIIIGLDGDNTVDGKASIVIKTNSVTNIKVQVYWWCVVVFMEIGCFCIVFFVNFKKKGKNKGK